MKFLLLLIAASLLVTPSEVAAERLLRSPLTYEEDSHNGVETERDLYERHLETACGETIVTWTAAEARSYVERTIDDSISGAGSFILKLLLRAYTFNGVQIKKICASCASETSPYPDYLNYCNTTDYGYNAVNSGLLMIPLKSDKTFLDGTLPGSMYCHGTSTARVPTTIFTSAEELDIEMALNVASTATGKISLLPDYLGYGESSGTIHKGYLIKKQYLTSVIPLWLKAQSIVKEESNCGTALADAAALTGFSEGGYASVVLADGLNNIGTKVVQVHAGGGPYRMGSVAILSAIKSEYNGDFPQNYIYYFALLGAAYSSTYEDVANYKTNQDLLNATYRQDIVDMVYESKPAGDIKTAVVATGALNLMDQALVDFALNRIAANDYDPCKDENQNLPGFNDKLCDAFGESDLTEILETAPYPVNLCHSPSDEIVDIQNLPDFTKNPLNLRFVPSSGKHEESAYNCLIGAMMYLLGDGLVNAPYDKNKHIPSGCPAV